MVVPETQRHEDFESLLPVDHQEQTKVLHCLEEIAGAFSTLKTDKVSTKHLTGALVTLERNVGHFNVTSLLESIGISIDKSTASLTTSLSEIGQTLQGIRTDIEEKKAPSTKRMPYQIREESILRSLGISSPNIDQFLPPTS